MALLCREGCIPQCQWSPFEAALFPMEIVKEARLEAAGWWSVAVEAAVGVTRLDSLFRGACRGTQGSYDVNSPKSTAIKIKNHILCVSNCSIARLTPTTLRLKLHITVISILAAVTITGKHFLKLA